MTPRRFSILLAALLLAGLFFAPGVARAEDAEPVDLATAERDLDILEAKLKSRRSITEEILAALDAVSAAYHGLTPPTEPEPQPIPDDADEEAKKAIEKANKAAQDAYEVELKKHERAAEKFRKSAIKLFLKALKLQKINKNTESNLRDPVNVKAATLLGQTGDPGVASDLINALEKTIFKANYEVPQQLLEEVFNAIATLNQPKSLEWMIDEFTHSKMSPTEEVDRLKAAHKSMILFTDVPGKLRHALVEEMQKTYGAVESQAKQSSSDPKIRVVKEFWDSIKTDVIKAVQHFSGSPKNEENEVLGTMEEFVAWFRDHKNVKRAPWVDE